MYNYFQVLKYMTPCIYMVIPYIHHDYTYISYTCDNLLTPISHLIIRKNFNYRNKLRFTLRH